MKLKKILAGALAAVMAVGSMSLAAFAEDEALVSGDFEYEVLGDGTVSITAYNGSDEKVEIPAQINGMAVTKIGDSAFQSCTSLTEIEIPDGVASIGTYAFSGCYSLAEIELPASVTGIAYGTFESCSSLSHVEIPNSVTSISSEAFRGCASLTAINVDKDSEYYTSIDGVLFNKVISNLIWYPAGKTETAYTIPDSVTALGAYAFFYCTSLAEIKIPDGVTRLGSWNTFTGCSSLAEIEIPDGVTSIGMNTFYNCTSLAKIKIPESVTEIGWGAFGSCHDDLTIYGYTGSYAETYANENEFSFSPIGFVLTDEEETGIKIVADEGAVLESAELNIKEIESDDDTQSITFDISLTDTDGEETQPAGSVTVKIPVPAEWDTSEGIYVYHRDENGNLTDMHATVIGGYAVFTTDHFSKYILTTQKLITVTVGDINGDTKVDDLDVVALARYLANWSVTIDEAAADVNGDGVVNDLDVVMLARRLAGWNI